ncbi:tetratricopeptide repeat protein [bacterium AH-315-M05]|nr:tetratricopeptide repeat protein [bacterium AH-315-M05]
MKKLIKIFVISLIAYCRLSTADLFANSTKVDSLLQALQTATDDTAKIKTLNTLAWEFKYNKPDTAILLSTQALELCAQLSPSIKRGPGGVSFRSYATAKSYHNLGVFNYLKGNHPLALDHYLKALKIWKQLVKEQPPPAFAKAMVSTLSNIGLVYMYQGGYAKALEYYFKVLKISEELGNTSHIAAILGNIGLVYDYQGDYPKALEYYFKALKIGEELRDKNRISIQLGNIGNVYLNQGDYPKALEYYFKALKMKQELGAKNLIASTLGNIGVIYREQGDYPKALEYYFKALKMRQEVGAKNLIASTLGNIGGVYSDQGIYPKALDYYFKALRMDEELGNKRGIAADLGNIGSIYTEQKNYSEAERYLLQAIELCDSIGALSFKMQFENSISILYEQTGQYQKAYEHYKAYSIAKDTLYNEEKSKEIGKLEAGFEYDKKLALEQAEHEKQSAVAASESKRQKVIIYAVSGGLLLLIVFFILLFNRFRIIRRQKSIIEEQKQVVDEKNVEITQKNKDITDSIRYAENIQKAILPPIEEIKKALPESFILFKPKDIVSGDFYFFSKVNQYTIIAACDCTGHGVPGAFMSMIGNSLLNEIVNDKSVTDAAEVLNQLRDGVIHAFGEAGATGEQKDGMDMALCAFKRDKDNGIVNLQYAGAYNPLYIVRNGKNNKTVILNEAKRSEESLDTEYQPAGDSSLRSAKPHSTQNDKFELTQIPADKQPVGFHYGKQIPFTNHEIQMQKGDTVYIFSDGYQDQFGGPRGKKFMSKRFRQLFIDIHTMNMEEQKEHLDKTIEEWKEGREQVDDILVIGVKV